MLYHLKMVQVQKVFWEAAQMPLKSAVAAMFTFFVPSMLKWVFWEIIWTLHVNIIKWKYHNNVWGLFQWMKRFVFPCSPQSIKPWLHFDPVVFILASNGYLIHFIASLPHRGPAHSGIWPEMRLPHHCDDVITFYGCNGLKANMKWQLQSWAVSMCSENPPPAPLSQHNSPGHGHILIRTTTLLFLCASVRPNPHHQRC